MNEISKTIRLLKTNRNRLTIQQFKTLKGQCLAGDTHGARKGLETILKRGVSDD